MTEIWIFRHGETEVKVLGKEFGGPLVCGHFKTKLTDRGKEQAFVVGTQHIQIPFDICYVSKLERSEESAIEFLRGAKQRHVEIVDDKNLDEVNYGGHDGMKEELVKKDKENYFANNPSGTSFAFSGDTTTLQGDEKKEFLEREEKYGRAESFDEAGKRYFETLQKIAKENQGKRILVLGHSGAMRAFEQYAGIKEVKVGESKGFLEPLKVQAVENRFKLI